MGRQGNQSKKDGQEPIMQGLLGQGVEFGFYLKVKTF